MTPAPTEPRRQAASALDRLDRLLDRLDQASQIALNRLTPPNTTETHDERPPDDR